jgi:hypothetical protein
MSEKRTPFNISAALSLFAGAIFYWLILGRQGILDPRSTIWLMEGDWFKHYTGWLHFLHEPWDWPLVKINSLLYPIGTSVTEMDCLPLLAIPFKMLRAWLPENPQYFGIWLLICFMLQGLFANLALQALGLSAVFSLAGSFFLISSPPLVFRLGHLALCGHFLILAALWLYIRTVRGGRKYPLLGFGILFATTAATHAYLLAMVLPIGVALAVHLFLARRTFLERRETAVRFFASLGLLALVCVPLGYFHIRQATAPAFSGYQADLLTFFTSFDTSRWVTSIRSPGGGYEGYAYLGLAGTGLLLYAGFARWKRRGRPLPAPYRPLLITCILMMIFAYSGRVTFGGNTILILDRFYRALEPLPSTFRTSGRFVWPLYYALWLYFMVVITRSLRPRRAMAVLVLAFALHWVEFSPWFFNRPDGSSQTHRYLTGLAASHIDFDSFRNLYYAPKVVPNHEEACQIGIWDEDVNRMVFYQATLHLMNINYAYAGRAPQAMIDRECKELDDRIRTKNLASDTLYVVDASTKGRFLAIPHIQCASLPGTASLCHI